MPRRSKWCVATLPAKTTSLLSAQGNTLEMSWGQADKVSYQAGVMLVLLTQMTMTTTEWQGNRKRTEESGHIPSMRRARYTAAAEVTDGSHLSIL
jgi:hypothetical protein